ncbi:MAG: glycosyltransferase family 4 protein [Paracoccaceae bacterium]
MSDIKRRRTIYGSASVTSPGSSLDFTVLQLLPALGDGGVERSTVQMAQHLRRLGITSWVASAPGPLGDALHEARTGHIRMNVGAKNPLRIWRHARRLARLIDRHKIDLVHARSRAPAWVGYLACRMARRRPAFITTFHGVYGHKSALKRRYNAIMIRGALVIANSRFIAAHIREIYQVDAARIVVAPRGFDTEVFDPARLNAASRRDIRQEFGAQGVPLFALVARLSGWKGHRVLISALALLADLPWVAVFAGGADDSETMRRLQSAVDAAGLHDRVHLAGSRADIAELLAACDLAFSMATRPEAFGRATIEAAAMQTPVIASAHGGALETVLDGETGWLVAPGDADAVAAAVRTALSGAHDLNAMGKAGRRFVLQNFTAQQCVQKEFGAYQALLKRAPDNAPDNAPRR